MRSFWGARSRRHHVTSKDAVARCPLTVPNASRRCIPETALDGIMTDVASVPSARLGTLTRSVLPCTGSWNQSRTPSSAANPEPLIETTVPGGPEEGLAWMAETNGTRHVVPSQTHVSP